MIEHSGGTLAAAAPSCYRRGRLRKRTMLLAPKTYLPTVVMLDRKVQDANARAWRG